MTAYARNIAEKGIAKGLAEGRNEERELISQAFQALKSGKSPEELISNGFEEATVNTALAFLS